MFPMVVPTTNFMPGDMPAVDATVTNVPELATLAVVVVTVPLIPMIASLIKLVASATAPAAAICFALNMIKLMAPNSAAN